MGHQVGRHRLDTTFEERFPNHTVTTDEGDLFAGHSAPSVNQASIREVLEAAAGSAKPRLREPGAVREPDAQQEAEDDTRGAAVLVEGQEDPAQGRPDRSIGRTHKDTHEERHAEQQEVVGPADIFPEIKGAGIPCGGRGRSDE